ncbi:hypothetical protein BH20ACT5_BH20ACT5_17020 [soil metagenome]
MRAGESAEFEQLLDVLRHSRGFDFTCYQRTSLTRRVRHRMNALGIAEYGDYRDRLELDPAEFAALFDTILINVTSFFRDRAGWDAVRDSVIPAVLERGDPDRAIRVWSAGCASGEEVYSLAMLLAEAMGASEFSRRVKIYATDVDADALRACRAGRYTARQLEAVSPQRRERFFERTGADWTVRAELRRAVVCGRNDLTRDAPISRIDLLACRNTLMYFTAQTQEQILRRLAFGLAETGFLFVGSAELLLLHSEVFRPVDLPNRLFRKASAPPVGPFFTVARAVEGRIDPTERIDPPAETLLGLRATDIGRAFHELETATDTAASQRIRDDLELSRQDLELAYEKLRSTSELLEITQEQLHSTIEELRTTNDHLHSANEELRAMNQELQLANDHRSSR